jgi:predicted DCC family thiol-disulfide oxidoreductase YuxK
LFDGLYNLCNATVRSLARKDPAGGFRFTPLESAAGTGLALVACVEQRMRRREGARRDALEDPAASRV